MEALTWPTRTAARPRRDAGQALKADVGRQVQAPRPRALGKSAAEGPNDRLQADLIDFSQNTRGKTKYILRPGGDGRLLQHVLGDELRPPQTRLGMFT